MMKGFRSTTTAAALRALFAFFAIVCDDAIGFVTTATRLPVRLQSTGSWIKSRIFPGTPSARRANGIDRGVRGLTATLPSNLQGRERLEKFINDCALLGPVRFVCMTEGAILETVGSFDNLRYSDQSKGRYATVSEGNGFECHLNLDKIKSINMVTKKSPSDEHQLYITRFLDAEGGTLLSAMLHGVDGSYEPGAAEYWEKLQHTFGAEQSVA